MERDFLGLSSKDSLVTVKEEVKEGCKDSAFVRGPGMQWPFSNKVSALPQFMSFKAAQEDRPKKTLYDPILSSKFMPISTADAFDSNHKIPTGLVQHGFQKNFNLERQGNKHFPMTAYPVQHGDAQSVRRSQEIRMFSVPNQAISVAMSNPSFKNHSTISGQNLAAATMKQQAFGGIPITAQHSVLPMTGPMGPISDLRNISKPSGAPAQLTIFYGGAVHVYDDVSHEKAQAIMLLAGNGYSMNANTAHTRAQVQAPTPNPAAGDTIPGNHSHAASPCSALSSPISVTSHAGTHSGSGSSSTDELMAAKPIGAFKAPTSQPEPPKMPSSLGSPATALMPSAVPQARKASLARFLEKRKERVMNSAPYNGANMYAEVGLWNEAANVRRVMRTRGLRKMAGESCIEVGGTIHRFCSGDESQVDYKAIYGLLDALNLQTNIVNHE